MTPSTHEPLTPEERDLAQRLSRLGPHGGPSPALDAKILAAAHAAVAAAPSRRRRWWALTGIPGSLVTGTGMAAALVLVVGVVWQMRPSSPPAQLPADDGDMGYISAEIIKPDAPAAASAKAPAPPPVEPARVLSADAAAASAPAPARRQAPQHRAETAVAAADTGAAASAPAQDSAVAASDYATETYAAAPMVAATPPAEMQAARQRAKQAADREATAQLDRVEVTGSRIAAKAMAAPPAPAAAPAAPQAFNETASIVALADIPVREDSALGIDDWVERIRARRDAGDLDDARASLAAFRDAHPKHRLPDDLRELTQSTR